jgi:hypothetical protein
LLEKGSQMIWDEIVAQVLSLPTRMGITKVYQMFLVIAFRHDTSWGLIAVPVTKEDISTVAAASTQDSSFPAITLLHKDACPSFVPMDSSTAKELASFPLGLIVVGTTADQNWADEEIWINADVLAQSTGRSEQDELTLLNEFAFDCAHSYIARLHTN